MYRIYDNDTSEIDECFNNFLEEQREKFRIFINNNISTEAATDVPDVASNIDVLVEPDKLFDDKLSVNDEPSPTFSSYFHRKNAPALIIVTKKFKEENQEKRLSAEELSSDEQPQSTSSNCQLKNLPALYKLSKRKKYETLIETTTNLQKTAKTVDKEDITTGEIHMYIKTEEENIKSCESNFPKK